jgi:hypothetical protein
MEYPSNSQNQGDKPGEPKAKETEPKNVEKIVSGEVVRRKKSLSKRFKETFIAGDGAKTAISYVFYQIIIPGAKDVIADSVSMGVEKMIFGEARSASRRTGRRPGSNGENYIRYDKQYNQGSSMRGREDPRGPSRRSRATFDFDEIILPTRVEAEQVIDKLFDLVVRYQQASVKDFYDICGITAEYTDAKWGWTNLSGASWTRVRNGYLLDLPKPELLE